MSTRNQGLLERAFRLIRKVKPVRERVTLGEFNDHVEREHVARYEFAKGYCQGKKVADMACGTGYGSELLRSVALSVDSYDKDSLCGNRIVDLNRDSWTDHYDVIVSFETIEHLQRPEFFLKNVHATCDLFVVSTPIGEFRGYNPHHEQVWSLKEFQAMLSPLFKARFYSQDGEKISADPGAKCSFVVAVCEPIRVAVQ